MGALDHGPESPGRRWRSAAAGRVASSVALAVGISLAFTSAPRSTPLLDEELGRLLAQSPLTGRPVDSIEELLPLLPAALRESFTLVHRSRSPHGGLGERAHASVDELHPRVILFSPDARLILAFTGAPDRPGADELEVLRFVDAGARFTLGRFVLPAAVRRDPGLAAAAAHNGEVDPPECLRCHGRDVRPLLDSYPIWPGFYGAVQDTFPPPPPGPDGTVGEAPGLGPYRRFLAEQKDAPTGVYRHLRWPSGTSVPPYTDPRGYDPGAVESSPDQLRLQPNTRLGMALAELSRKRIERRFATSPRHARDRYAALAVLLGCEAPPLTLADHAAVRAALGAENAARLERLGFRPRNGEGELGMFELGAAGNAARVLYVARLLGIDARDLAMAFEPGSLALYDGILGAVLDGRSHFLTADLALEVLRRLASDEPAFARFFVTRASFAGSGYPFGEKLDLGAAVGACPLLLERQHQVGGTLPDVEALGEWVAAPPLASDRAAAAERDLAAGSSAGIADAAVDRCTRCHEGTGATQTGRPIPLSSPSLLRPLLGRPAFSSERSLHDEILARLRADALGRMPPHGAAASPQEIADLARYLDAVAAGRAP